MEEMALGTYNYIAIVVAFLGISLLYLRCKIPLSK
jgi:hypothetical protein